jgi:ribonuclease-3
MRRKAPRPKDVERRIGYAFGRPELLENALTHLSAVPADAPRSRSYQRFEFLGDRVLGLAVAAMLVEAFPNADEGELSRRLAELVRAEACAEVAMALDLGPAIRMAAGEANSGGRRKAAILSDVCESVIGAVYADGGFEPARDLVERLWRERMQQPRRPLRDAKTTLQEWAQGRGLPPPLYEVLEREGPAHKPKFRIGVSVGDFAAAEGEGASKRGAEQAAAAAWLEREGIALETGDE